MQPETRQHVVSFRKSKLLTATTMWSFNPAVYLQHAWGSTRTMWGRLSLILFYSFIWISILSALWSLIAPESQGMDCIFGNASNKDLATLRVLLRGINLFVIAFLFYADKSGLHSSNVGIVTVVVLLWTWMWHSYLKGSERPACAAVWDSWKWIWPAWVGIAFVTILLDEKLGDDGTEEERQNLNA